MLLFAGAASASRAPRSESESEEENSFLVPGNPKFDLPHSEDEVSVQDDAQRTVLGPSFLINKRHQDVSNHPSMVSKKTRQSTKRANEENQDSKATRKSKRGKSKNDEEASYSGSEAPDSEAEDDSTSKLMAVMKQNQLLKLQNQAYESAGRGSKSGPRSTASAIRNVIIEAAKQIAFPKCAFLNANTIKGATKKVMNSIDILEHEGLKPSDLKQAQADWVAAHQKTIRLAFNEYRNYHQSQAKKLWEYTNNIADFDVPNEQEVEAVAKRQGLTDKDPNPERMRQVFVWYWDSFLPIIASNKRWGKGKRHYNCLSTARPNNDPAETLYVTPSDEAYAVVVWENYAPFWTWKAEIKAAKREPTQEDLKDPRSEPAYTKPKGGVAEWGGWSKEGRKRYRTLLEEIKVTKGEPDSKTSAKKKQFNHVKAVEMVALESIQQANNINLAGRAARRNPAANKDDEVDSDHEVDWD